MLETPEAERAAFLKESCGDDDQLRVGIEALLRSDDKAGGFLGRLVREQEDEPPAEEVEISAGRRLGPYRLLRRIGEGGMSTVYLADRVDGSFRRPVVVKVIRQGMESGETLRRLRLERQILAGLEHPNIARLYDGGTTEEHLPYFVMELVEGTSLDEHCDRRRLRVMERLELFRKVCAAVQYAHQNLVVHRDLKPGNILVTAQGEPKLLDFGIAKLLDPVPGDVAEEPTVAWARRMTPNYASPEQILGRKITTASDVYSLGVVLYKLLAGCLPRRFEGCSALEIETLLTSEPAGKPSDMIGMSAAAEAGHGQAAPAVVPTGVAELRRTTPERLRRMLTGDLDRIVLKALHPEPARRYSTPEQLAEDLRRHQDGLPIQARSDTLVYRTGKFLHRHRVAVGMAALVSIVLAASAVGLAVQSVQIARERDQLRAVVSFVKSVFNVAGEGEELTVRQAVDRSAVVLDLELKDQPEVQATLLDVTGTIYLNLLQVPQARAQLAKAVDLRSEVFGSDSLAFAESLSTLGVADALLDDYELGERRAREAVAIYRDQLGDRHPDLVGLLNNLVSVLCYKGEYAIAEESSVEALALARDLLNEERFEYGDAVAFRALVFAKLGDQGQAEALYREALGLHRRYRGERHPKVTTVLNNLALALKRQDKFDEAADFYRQVLDLQRDLLGEKYPEVAVTLNNLGSLLRAKGDLRQAEETYREAVSLAREIFGPSHSGVLVTTTGLALVLIESGQAQAAEALLRGGLELWSESLPGSWYLAYTRSVLGESLTALGRYDEAEPLLVTSYQELRVARGDEAPKTRDARRRVEAFYQASGRRPPDSFLPS